MPKKKLKTIAARWESCKAKSLPAAADPAAVRACQALFYAGAMTSLVMLMTGTNTNTLMEELNQFFTDDFNNWALAGDDA